MDFTSHQCHVEGCSLAPEPNAPATRIPEISTLTQRGRQLHTRALAQQVPKFQQPGPKSRMADFAKHAPSLCSQLSIRKVTLSPQRQKSLRQKKTNSVLRGNLFMETVSEESRFPLKRTIERCIGNYHEVQVGFRTLERDEVENLSQSFRECAN